MENYPYPSYPDSHESSPRSRDTDFENLPPWDDQQPPPNYKAKFMCSYGGKIQPRTHDNQLSYVGGETKILAVDRHIKFPSFISKLSTLSNIPPEQLTLKYQLPDEELDALISVTNDDDLDHLMHEYDRLYRASSRPARMRLFLFTNPTPTTTTPPVTTSSFSSECDRFVEALNSGGLSVQPEPIKPQPLMHSNVDFLFGLDKAVAPPPPVAAVKFHDQVPDPVAPGPVERRVGSDSNVNPIEIQRQLQQMRIAESEQYRRRSEDGFSGGFSGGSGDYYMQKLPEKVSPSNSPVSVPHHAGFFPERQLSGGGFQPTVTTAHGGVDQHVYMVSAPGTYYHAPHAPVVRPSATQGYYAVQRMGSDGYREQTVYGGVAPSKAVFSSVAPSSLAPAQPVRGSTYAEGYGVIRPAGVPDNSAATYAQMTYDSASGRQVYYNAPGGVMHAPPFQGASPAINATDMRSGGVSSGQDVKVVNKVNQGPV
ncbi:hypothetical protein Lal_00007896 [Lupinus albus]|uniref:Putative PB1 domain-containing protein n=1 Tax=Lupinus albus TaxID=3870 RepID=A0A6A4P367_LUPAL|nr:putative PB1 domain-containing protein [Lupinus albus]KAF1875280.1 hypothetical protein Lal_00007896 [Lupinus albus]